MSANDANDPVPLLVRDRRRGSLYYVPAGTTIPPSFRLAEATTSPGRDIHEILYHHRPRVTDVSNLPTGSAPGSKSHSTTDTGDKLLEWLEMEDEDADEGTASVLFVHDPSMLDRLHEILHERLVDGQVGEDLHAEILCFYKEQERVGRVEKFEYEGSSLGAFRLGTASLVNTLLQAPGLYHSIETGRRAKESRWIDGKKFGRSILDFMLRIRDKPAVGGDGKRVAVYPIEGMRITQTTSADGEGYRLSCVGGALTCVDLEGYEICRKISSQVYCDMRDAQVIYVLVVNSDEDAQLFRLDERLKVSVSSVIPHATGDRNRVLSDQVSNQRNRPRPTLLSTMLALAFAAPIDGYPHDLFNAPGPPSPDDDGADPMEEDREPSRYAHRQGREYQHDLRRDRDDDDGAPPHPGPGRGGLNTHRGMDLGLEQTAPDDRGDENARREEKVRADGKGSLSDLVPHLQHVSTWPQPAKVALPSGTIDLSRLSFRDRLEPRTHLRISGPGLTFEHHENVNANVSNLVLDCVSVDETDHGRLWTVFQARLYGIGNGDGDDVEKREKSDSAMNIYNHTTNIDVDVDMMSRTFAHADQTYRTITNHIDKRASNISAISSDLGNVPAISVVLKVFLTQSTPSTPNSKDRYEFRAEDAAINEADLYQGPLAPLQGKVVPRCYGVFRAVLGGRRTCWVMVLEMLDELTVPWGMLDNGARREIILLYTRLHEVGVQHRDLELRHVRVDPSDGTFRLIDFDGAALVDSDEKALDHEKARLRRLMGVSTDWWDDTLRRNLAGYHGATSTSK